MRVLGLSCDFHDSAAALVVDGEIVAAVEEERLSRRKHDNALPERAIASCLAIAGLVPDDLDAVVMHEKPLVSLARVMAARQRRGPGAVLPFARELPTLLRRNLLVSYRIEQALRRLGASRAPDIRFSEHHLSHAAAAYLPSPFDRAAVLTIDGIGEWATASYGCGFGGRVELLAEQRYPDSLGLLYSLATVYCGFEANDGEYKLMGLAPYGQPRYVDQLREILQVHPDGSLTVDDRAVGRWSGSAKGLGRLHGLLDGPPADPGAVPGQREADIARSFQDLTEDVVLAMAGHVHRETGERQLVMAGGVALNCVANGRLLREGPFDEVWVQPAAGDAGSALGAALWFVHGEGGVARPERQGLDAMRGAFLGPQVSADEVDAWLRTAEVPHRRVPDRAQRCQEAAERLASGAYVGWFEGAMEFGPRALGHRSILADPRSATAQSDLNLKIKGREGFRPFAPAVLAEEAGEWFELDAPSPYMLFTFDVADAHRTGSVVDPTGGSELLAPEGIRSEIPACTHVDHSARVQTVAAGPDGDTSGLRGVLEAFDAATGCPVLLNTSFNVAGEPIVCTPDDALASARRAGLDLLVIEDSVIELAEVPALLAPDPGTWTQVPDPSAAAARQPGRLHDLWSTLLALVITVLGPAARASVVGGDAKALRLAGIVAAATLVQSRLTARWWWARHLLVLATAVAIRPLAGDYTALWAAVAMELVDLVVWERPPAPELPAGHRSALPGLVVLSLIGASGSHAPGREVQLVVLLGAMTAISLLSAARPAALQRAVAAVERVAGRAVSIVAGCALAVPMILLPWLVHRLLRFEPLRPPLPPDSSWQRRAGDGDVRSREPWRRDAVRARIPLVWRLQRTASSFVIAAIVAGALVPLAVRSERTREQKETGTVARHQNTDPNKVPEALADASWYDDYQQDLSWLWQTSVAWDPLAPVRLRDGNTRYVNIEDGARRTWRPPSCDCRRLRVWMYGGSTTFGLGQRDAHTTASAMARAAWQDGVALDIDNRGVVGDTQWEEAQRFAWDLGTLPAPDLVVFLDGINDTQAIARLKTQTRQPMNFVKDDFWMNYLEHAKDVGMDGRWAPTEAAGSGPPGASVPKPKALTFAGADELGSEIARRYEIGRSISRTMAKGYKVPISWFWQPSIDSRPFVEGEPPPNGRTFAFDTYQAAVSRVGEPVIDISRVLDEVPGPLYWDQYHTNERGASVIGRAMYQELKDKIVDLQRKKR